MPTGMTDEHRVRMARVLKKASIQHEAPIWRRLSEYALKPSGRTINVKGIEARTKDGDVVVFPGKVLGTGSITHKIGIFCFGISESAATKIVGAGGRILNHTTIISERPTGKEVVMLG